MEVKNWFDAIDKDEFYDFLKILYRTPFIEVEFYDNEFGDCKVHYSEAYHLLDDKGNSNGKDIYGPFGMKLYSRSNNSIVLQYMRYISCDEDEQRFFEFMCKNTIGKICNGQTYTEAWIQAHRLAEIEFLKGEERRTLPEYLDKVKSKSLARIRDIETFAKTTEAKYMAEIDQEKTL